MMTRIRPRNTTNDLSSAADVHLHNFVQAIKCRKSKFLKCCCVSANDVLSLSDKILCLHFGCGPSPGCVK